MKTCVRFVRVMALCAIVIVTAANGAYAADAPHVTGIIMLIGDGMGINQVGSASIYARKVSGKSLAIDSIQTRGTTTTYSASSGVTDSAAAATALYTGHKANNGAINILPDKAKAYTIGEAAKKAGMAVGFITTARITDATPAGIYGHVPDRKMENLLADQLVEFMPDVAMGGSLRHFIPKGEKKSKREDDKNLVEAMKTKGYTYVAHAANLKAVDLAKCEKLFGLFAMSNMAYDIDRQNDAKLGAQPTIADMTRATLAIVARNPKGFFVMIEGGRIDHACHTHDLKASIEDTIAFDAAVEAALDFQKSHPDVLVLVTADHETGGLGLGRGAEYACNVPAVEPIKHSLEYITKHVEKNPDKVADIVKSAGFELTEAEQAILAKNAAETKTGSVVQFTDGDPKTYDKYASPWISYALGQIESERAKVGWTTYAHTEQPVITYAAGPGSSEFSGHYDNTDIAKKMAKLLGVTLEAPKAP